MGFQSMALSHHERLRNPSFPCERWPKAVDFGPMVTHRFKLDDIEAAYDLFGHQRGGVLKVAITP